MTPQENHVGDLNTQSLEQVFNSEPMRQIRLDMLADREPASCTRCYEQERAGQLSMRMDVNRRYAHHQDLIATTAEDGSAPVRLAYWDFRFSNICNFRCRSCGPQLSSGWYDDHKRLSNGHLPPDCPPAGKNITQWEAVEPYLDTVEEIYFAGGEPLIMEEHYRILNALIDRKRFDVKLRYNTNFSQMRYKSLDAIYAWQKFPHVKIDASLDGMGDQAEYIRKGTTWSHILQNRQRLSELAPHVWFGVNCTTSVQNSYHIVQFWNWCTETGFILTPDHFHINLVQDPEWLRLQILPQHIKQDLADLYTTQKRVAERLEAHNMARDWASAVHFMQAQDRGDQLPVFRKRMQALDDIRNESFATTFPELAELICE